MSRHLPRRPAETSGARGATRWTDRAPAASSALRIKRTRRRSVTPLARTRRTSRRTLTSRRVRTPGVTAPRASTAWCPCGTRGASPCRSAPWPPAATFARRRRELSPPPPPPPPPSPPCTARSYRASWPCAEGFVGVQPWRVWRCAQRVAPPPPPPAPPPPRGRAGAEVRPLRVPWRFGRGGRPCVRAAARSVAPSVRRRPRGGGASRSSRGSKPRSRRPRRWTSSMRSPRSRLGTTPRRMPRRPRRPGRDPPVVRRCPHAHRAARPVRTGGPRRVAIA